MFFACRHGDRLPVLGPALVFVDISSRIAYLFQLSLEAAGGNERCFQEYTNIYPVLHLPDRLLAPVCRQD